MKKIILSTAVLTALLSMSTAYAGGSSSIFSDTSGGGATAAGLYGGASVGRAFNDDCATATFSEGSGHDDITCTRNTDNTAWKVFGGYKVMPSFAVEGAYIDFGEVSNTYEGSLDEDGTNTWGKASDKIKGVSLMGVASTSVTDNIDVFGKLGVLRWDRDSWVSYDQNDTSKPSTFGSTQGTDLAIGAGAEVNVSDNIAIRGEVEHFDDIDVNLFSLGASFSTL